VGVGKSGVLEHKSGNISETRKDRGKGRPSYCGGPIGTHQRSFEQHHSRPPSGPYALPLSRLDIRNPQSKIQTLHVISRTGEAINFKFGWYIHRVHPNKSPLKH